MRNIGTVLAAVVMLLLVGSGLYFLFGGTPQGVIETRLGTIVIEFFPDEAPRHVDNWKSLAREGFYDGTLFHRVSRGYVVQGGDPKSKDSDPWNDGTGGPGYYLDEEFNEIPHVAGIVSMARAENVNSAGSQFFICLGDIPLLDHQFTVFGRVVEGMDVVYEIASLPLRSDIPERPVDPVAMDRVKVRTIYRLPLVGEIVF